MLHITTNGANKLEGELVLKFDAELPTVVLGWIWFRRSLKTFILLNVSGVKI